MPFGLRYDNQITSVLLPSDLQRIGQQRHFPSPDGSATQPTAPTPGMYGRLVLPDTLPATGNGPVGTEEQPDEIHRSALTLPIPCNVQWTSAKQIGTPESYFIRVGVLLCRYQPDVLRNVLVDGAAVKFDRTLPNKEGFWYRLAGTSVTPPAFQPGVGTVECQLSEMQLPEATGLV